MTAVAKLSQAQLAAALEQQADGLQRLDEQLAQAAAASDLLTAKRIITQARAELAALAKVQVRACKAHEGR